MRHSPDDRYDLDEQQLRTRAQASLHRNPTHAIFDPRSEGRLSRGDFDLNPDLRADLATEMPPQTAAVLVPIIRRERLSVLFTQRSKSLRRHAGQIAFPGGRTDDEDLSPLETALREAEEEVGIRACDVEPLGYLDTYRTGTGYLVTPLVALISEGVALRPDPTEVEAVFEVPLAFVMAPENFEMHSRPWQGRLRRYYAIPYRDHYIWGATAGMLKNLHERLFDE